MTEVVYKYPLKRKMVQQIDMPKGAQILTVQVQNGQPVMWARVDLSQPMESRIFAIYSTGHAITDHGRYIETFQISGLVFHVFEEYVEEMEYAS